MTLIRVSDLFGLVQFFFPFRPSANNKKKAEQKDSRSPVCTVVVDDTAVREYVS